MLYTLEQLSADIRDALKADSGEAGKQAVCGLVWKVLLDKDFVAQHLNADQCRPRKVLYEDPDLGFCVCGHVYETAAHGSPHDHASSWAIYGVAAGHPPKPRGWITTARRDDGHPDHIKNSINIAASSATQQYASASVQRA